MKKFAVLLVALAFATTTFAGAFSDVPRTHWAYDAIQKAVSAGILQGYDGKFHGKRLLNRYQMAVITAKLLEQMRGVPTRRGAVDGDVKKMIANLEALTIEFADELALLNVKVSTLEDSFQELKMKGGACAAPCASGGGDIGFTAFAAFALVINDEDLGGASRYSARGSAPDTTLFDLQQVSLGVDKEVNPGVYFHAQMDFASDLNNVNGVAVNQAYFFVDELFGDIGGKVGAFAPPFSMEHNGPFRTCNLTISPSIANTYHDIYRYTGLEIQKTKDVQPDDIIWKFGIVSGTDGVVASPFLLSDYPVAVNRVEADDGFGFYLYIGKKPERSGDWGWNLSFFDNGGDTGATAPAVPSSETGFWQFGFEWANDDMLVMIQYLDGSQDFGGAADLDFTTWYILFNYKIDEKASVTLRYDDLNQDLGAAEADGNAITFAYNRKVTENSIMQFEYVSPDGEDFFGGTDADDDLVMLRYKVHF